MLRRAHTGRATEPRCGQSRGTTTGERAGACAAWAKACLRSPRAHLGASYDLKQTELRTHGWPRLPATQLAPQTRGRRIRPRNRLIFLITITKRHGPFAQRPLPEWDLIGFGSHVDSWLCCVVKATASLRALHFQFRIGGHKCSRTLFLPWTHVFRPPRTPRTKVVSRALERPRSDFWRFRTHFDPGHMCFAPLGHPPCTPVSLGRTNIY